MSAVDKGTNVYAETFTIRAPRRRVWEGLTSSDDLAVWFAEHAEVELHVGGAYRFWGRHTPSYGAAATTDQTITALEDGRLLAFNWRWGGTPTECELRLEDGVDGSCLLHVRQRFGAALPGFDDRISVWVARDFWQLGIANLESYLRTGRPALMVDHSLAGGRKDVELSIEIEAPASAVWASLTDPERMRGWLGKDPDFPVSPEVELRVGGRYTYGWEGGSGECMGPGRILELEPGRRLVHDWRHDGDDTGRTEWTIEELGPDRSRLTVRQIGTGSAREFSGYANGWAAFLVAIRGLLRRA